VLHIFANILHPGTVELYVPEASDPRVPNEEAEDDPESSGEQVMDIPWYEIPLTGCRYKIIR
jgi:hypothetical protein